MRLKDWRKYLGQRQGIVTRCFVYVFGDWWSGMSGALSIPFAALAVLNVFSARKEFVLLAFAALFITIGRLAYKSVPRFKISTCSVNERKSAQNYWGPNKPVIFYQVRVDLLGKGSVKDCCARLLKIQRDKDVRWEGQAVELTFSPGEAPDALSKTLNDEIPEYVDVVILPSDHSIFLGVKGRQWAYQPPLQEIFRERGKYLITIAVRGGIGATQKALLEFVWNEWDTSTLEVVNPCRSYRSGENGVGPYF